jgi:hypothetical protein
MSAQVFLKPPIAVVTRSNPEARNACNNLQQLATARCDAGSDPEEFQCSIAPDSPFNFTCSPVCKQLQPCPTPGQPTPPAPVQVHFTCIEFGKTLHGMLRVHTAQAEYSFAIIGRQPMYRPPDPSHTMHKVDDRLKPEIVHLMAANRQAGRRRKYIKDNIARTKLDGVS